MLQSDARKEALRRNPEYTKYIKNLVSAGYFGSEVEGSEKWNFLETKAVTTFIEVRREEWDLKNNEMRIYILTYSFSDATRPSFSAMLTTAISQSTEESTIPTQKKEDSDDWLNIDAANFDDMLEKTMGTSKSKPQTQTEAMDIDGQAGEETEEDRLAKEQASRLQDLAQKVEDFVEGEGDVEGAKFEE